MELMFYNSSKTEIFITANGNSYSVLPNDTIVINIDSYCITLKLIANSRSYIEKFRDTAIGYKLNVEAEYSISANNEQASITLCVIGVEGDHYEYYMYVVPVAENAKITHNSYNIPDVMNVKGEIIYYDKRRKEKHKSKKNKRRRENRAIDILLDILYSALPIIVVVWLLAHNAVKKSTLVVIMLAILAVVVFIEEIAAAFYDKMLKKHFDKLFKCESGAAEFDITSIFDESHIKEVVNDKSRYQNRK